MTNRLELNWKLDGFVDEQRYYCSETPIDVNNLPSPKSILAGDVRTYVDTAIELGKTYHVCVGSVKNGVEKLSEQKQVGAGFWTPLDLPFEIVFTNSENVETNISGYISQLSDIGGGDRNFTQSIEAGKPLLVSDTNFDVIRFDGVNDYLSSFDANQFLAGKNCAWIFSVFKATAARAQGVVATRIGNNGVGLFNIYAGTGSYSTKFGLLSRALATDSAALTFDTEEVGTGFRMVLGYRDYTKLQQELIIDSKNTYTTSAPAKAIDSSLGSSSVAVIGAEVNTPSSPFKGDLCCVLIGTNQLTQEEKDKLFGWAAHKYGLTANLPIDHPYKILIPTL